MAARAKVLESMTKHMTAAEAAARESAESELLTGVELSPDAPPAQIGRASCRERV